MKYCTVKLEKVIIDESGCHLVLPAFVNFKKLHLVLDTGASRTVIHAGFFDKNLVPEEEYSIGLGSNSLESYQVDLEDFRIGELVFKEYKVAALDLNNVIETYQKLDAIPVLGVLGGDILEKYYSIIDYKNLELKLCLSLNN